MNAAPHFDQDQDLDEGSWVYLSLGSAHIAEHDLSRRVIEACQASGWPAVSWSSQPNERSAPTSARFFEGMSHAVEQADAVIVLMDDSSAMADVELAFAYRHNRPIVGLRIGERGPSSEMQAMLQRHSRSCVVDCVSIDECVDAIRGALSNPEFGEIIREAAGGREGHA